MAQANGGTRRVLWTFTLLLFATIGSASATPPEFLGPIFLPGDTLAGPSGSDEESPAIAWGGGQALAVWADSRTNYFSLPPFIEDQGARDIYAARLDPAGSLIDSIPIAVTQEFGYQRAPLASWNGANWLVAWESQVPTQFSSASAVLAARVAPDGTVLDPDPIVIFRYTNSSSLSFSLTSNGSDWLVAAQATSAGEDGIYGARVSAGGILLDPQPVPMVPPTYYLHFNIVVHYAGGEYLLSYEAAGNPRARRFRADLAPIGGAFAIPGLLLQSNGNGYFVVWTAGGNLVGSPMTKEGSVAFPSGIPIAPTSGVYETDLAWDASNWWVSQRHASQGLILRRVTPTGQVLDPGGILVNPASAPFIQSHRMDGAGSGGVALVWRDHREGGPTPYDIQSAAVSATGTPGSEGAISLAHPAQLTADLCEGSNGFLLAFRSETSGQRRIVAQRLDPTGAAIDPEPIFLGSGSYVTGPAVAWNGSIHFVVWTDGTNILGKRVAADGTILDAQPIVVMAGLMPDVAAVGSTFLVVGTHYTYGVHFRLPMSMRVDGVTGALLDPQPRILGQYFARYPRVIACAGRWLAMWQRHPSHDNPQAELSGAFIGPDGFPTQEFREINPLGSGFTVDLAFSGSAVLIVARTGSDAAANTDLRAIRMLPDGSFPDGTQGFVLSSAIDKQLNPTVAWTGSEFLVAWDDKRNALAFFDERTDIYGSRVSEAGALLDPSGFAIARERVPEAMPALAASAGQTILAASIFRSGPPHASYRLGVFRVLDPAAAGDGLAAFEPAVRLTAHPNPFGAAPSLALRLDRAETVSLAIYDPAGRLVRRVIDGESLPAGRHEFAWDGRDEAGRAVPPGVYFARLKAGAREVGKRIIRIR